MLQKKKKKRVVAICCKFMAFVLDCFIVAGGHFEISC